MGRAEHAHLRMVLRFPQARHLMGAPIVLSVLSLLSLLSSASSHGVMQIPLPWQLGNVQDDLGRSSCVSGGCNWFTNWTFTTGPTMPQSSPLRSFADVPPRFIDWTANHPWRAPGRARVYSPCGSEGGNPDGCIQVDGSTMGRCVTDDGGFGFGPDGRSLGGLGVTTSWQQGSQVEAGWSVRSNHGGGYSYRLCKKPTDGNYSKITEECFTRLPLSFVGDTSWVQYGNGSGRFEIDALRTTTGTFPPGSQWTRNPIPSFGHGPQVMGNGTQFPLPTLHGQPVQTPSPLAGFCPCRARDVGSGPPWDAVRQGRGTGAAGGLWVPRDGAKSCYCCCSCCGHNHWNPGFDDWVLVDRLQVPEDLPTGDYVLGFRWDCEQSPQVWQQCASINIAPASAPPPPPQLAPLCGDEAHACCLTETEPSGVGTGASACAVWSAVSTCVLSKEHCENGTQRVGRENTISGCRGTWMPQVPPADRCIGRSGNACGFGCAGTNGVAGRACQRYADGGGGCGQSKSACTKCHGRWLRGVDA